jgi:thiamine biosynthesis lipoprotein
MNFLRLICWISMPVIITVLFACATYPQALELSGYTMGTNYSVRVIASNKAQATETLAATIEESLTDLDQRFSTYLDSSEINQFNNHTGDDWFEISPEFLKILQQGLHISELSNGAFDMTIGPLVDLWGFGPSHSQQTLPRQNEIDALLESTSFKLLEIQEYPPALRRTQSGVKLDLSAIAKGFAVDQIWELLDRAGFLAYMIEVGGEVRTRGMRTKDSDWMIGIENPFFNANNDSTKLMQNVVPLRDLAIATSGDYRNYFDHEGRRYSHTIDPRTGWAVSNEITAVSVISEKAIDADALATAFMVLGAATSMELAVREKIAMQLILRTPTGAKILQSSAYKNYLSNQ